MYNVLVCDDEKDIVSALKIYLSADGYTVWEAYNGKEALAMIKRQEIHLVLLDIMMPEMDGITAMAKIREQSNLPVILLTAKGEDSDKILGLNVGADDYITKPFNPAEVLARVRSQLRRYMLLGGGQVSSKQLKNGGIAMDDDCKTVTVDGETVLLTPTEYDKCIDASSHYRSSDHFANVINKVYITDSRIQHSNSYMWSKLSHSFTEQRPSVSLIISQSISANMIGLKAFVLAIIVLELPKCGVRLN